MHPLGLVSSPFVAAYCLRRAADDAKDGHPEAWQRVYNNFYVDNYIDLFDSVDEAEKSIWN